MILISSIVMAFLTLNFLSANAQITINPFSKKEFAENIAKLKASTMIFVVTDEYEDDIFILEEGLRKVWTMSECIVVPLDELGEYIDEEDYSYMLLSGFYTTGSGFSAGVLLNLQLKEQKGSKEVWKTLAYTYLYPTFESLKKMVGQNSADYLYKEIAYYNYTPGYITLYVKSIHDFLLLGKEVKNWNSDVKNSTEIAKLRKDTLYIPDYVLINFNSLSGNEAKRFTEEEVLGRYFYKCKILPAAEISNLILTNSINYVLVYTKYISQKFVTVYNVKSGEIIYLKYKNISYEFKDDDLYDISK